MKDPYLLIKTVTTVNTVSLPNDPLLFVANASDLNYPPGFFPYVLKTEIGNGRPFEFVRKQIVTTPAFDHEAAVYRQPGSPMMLHVLNDNSDGVRKGKTNHRN